MTQASAYTSASASIQNKEATGVTRLNASLPPDVGMRMDHGKNAPFSRPAIRPTLRAVLLFGLSLPVAMIVVGLFQELWYAALYLPVAAIVLFLVDLTMALPSRKLQIDLYCPPRLYLGKRYLLPLSLVSSSYRRETPIDALLEINGEADEPEIAIGALSEGKLELELALMPRRRGRIEVKAVWLRWRGPFKLMEFRRRNPVEKIVDILPDIQGIHETALQFFANDAVYGAKTQRLKGEGTEFDNLCEFSQGMDSRFIDWKHSARHRKLLCKEFRQERNHQIVFGFDTGHLMLEPLNGMPKLDHAIRAGLLLSWISLFSGDLVGGCAFDARFRNFLPPGRGMPYFTQFQRFSAALDYRTEETNFTLGLAELNSRLKRRALVILFTEFVDSISAELLLESLQIMTRRHLVVFVSMRDPLLTGLIETPPDDFLSIGEAVTAADFMRERAVVLEKVARLGVHCLDVSAQGVSSALLNKYLMIKQRGLL